MGRRSATSVRPVRVVTRRAARGWPGVIAALAVAHAIAACGLDTRGKLADGADLGSGGSAAGGAGAAAGAGAGGNDDAAGATGGGAGNSGLGGGSGAAGAGAGGGGAAAGSGGAGAGGTGGASGVGGGGAGGGTGTGGASGGDAGIDAGNPADGGAGDGAAVGPAVWCGAGQPGCQVGFWVCCVQLPPFPPYTCLPAVTGCVTGGTAVACDQSSDCPTNQVCCASSQSGWLSVDCVSTCDELQGDVQLCATSSECASPASCQPVPGVAGFNACQ